MVGCRSEWVNPLAPNPVRGKVGGSPASRSIHEVAAIFVTTPMQHQTRRSLVKIHLDKILVLITLISHLLFHISQEDTYKNTFFPPKNLCILFDKKHTMTTMILRGHFYRLIAIDYNCLVPHGILHLYLFLPFYSFIHI